MEVGKRRIKRKSKERKVGLKMREMLGKWRQQIKEAHLRASNAREHALPSSLLLPDQTLLNLLNPFKLDLKKTMTTWFFPNIYIYIYICPLIHVEQFWKRGEHILKLVFFMGLDKLAFSSLQSIHPQLSSLVCHAKTLKRQGIGFTGKCAAPSG